MWKSIKSMLAVCCAILVAGTFGAFAQNGGGTSVQGIVKDAVGPIVGATVITKDGMSGTTTSMDGSFTLTKVKDGDVIVISFIGYQTQEIPYVGQTMLDVTLQEEATALNAVVVTALGIKREEKALSYNVQQVKSDEITTVKDANFMNSLVGKVAGVTINAGAGGAGTSSRVIMRGMKSLEKSNAALYVIDGIPMYNNSFGGDAGGTMTAQVGSESIADINPEDIESINMLTGPSAAALYGSDAANGVVLINTKRGAEGKTTVTISNTTMFSKAYMLPEMQNRYGTSNTTFSWGDKINGTFDAKDFFNTGTNVINSVSLSTGTQKNQTYISVSTTNAADIIPEAEYNRYNFTARNTTKFAKDKLTFDFGASFVIQNNQNQVSQGKYYNPLPALYLFPRGDDIRKYQIYERYDATAGYMKQFWDLSFLDGTENPYWEVNRELFENTAQRYTFNATLKYDITSWLSLTGRARLDNMSMNYTRKIYASSNTLFASEYGNYQDNKVNHSNVYADVLLTVDKRFFNDDLSLMFNLGASIVDDQNNGSGFEGNLANLPNKFSLNNIDMRHAETRPYAERWHDQTQAIYATLQLGYKGMLYLDATFRNEWSSALAFTDHVNIPYPSVGLSAVISSMADLSKAGISFLKVRASYAEVGNAPRRFITGVNTPISTGGIISSDTYAPAVNLTPERTKSVEAGLNIKFLDDMVWLDATYYNTNTYNQLFEYDAPPSTGYRKAFINAGRVNNWGIEAALGFQNTWRDFHWSTSFTFSMNRNTIKELVPDGAVDVSGNPVTVDEVNMDYGGYRMKIKKGGSIGDFYVTGLKTDEFGQIYVDPNSNTVSTDPDTWIYGGNTEARSRVGWSNRFSWKGISLSFLFDARIGGEGVSATQAVMDRFGVSKASADARDAGGVWITGDQFIPDVKTFYGNNGNGMANLAYYVYDMTNIRLRELTIGYDLPRSWFKDKLGMTVSLVGRNLWMIYCKAPFDPELTASTGTYYQGIDYFMQPSTRNIGFSVRLQF